MEQFILVYTGKKIPALIETAIQHETKLLKATGLSEFHKICRTKPISGLFIAERAWLDFCFVAMHPEYRANLRFFIIKYKLSGGMISFTPVFMPAGICRPHAFSESPGRAGFHGHADRRAPCAWFDTPNEMAFRFEEILETHRKRCGENRAHPRANIFVEEIRATCGHKKCRDIFTLIVCSGERGINTGAIQKNLWPKSIKDRKNDIQSYICKIRGKIKHIYGCPFHITRRDDRYFFSADTQTENGGAHPRRE